MSSEYTCSMGISQAQISARQRLVCCNLIKSCCAFNELSEATNPLLSIYTRFLSFFANYPVEKIQQTIERKEIRVIKMRASIAWYAMLMNHNG